MKPEKTENIPTSLGPVTLGSLFKEMNSQMNSQMKKIESFLNEKIESLEARLKDSEAEKDDLQKEVEKLRSLLAAKERDYNLYYNQYQNIAKENEDLRLKLNEAMSIAPLKNQNLEHSAAINETMSESMLLTSPDSNNTPIEPDTTRQTLAQVEINDAALVQSSPRVIAVRERPGPSTSKCDESFENTSMNSFTPTHFKCTMCLKESGKATFYEDIDDYRNHVIQNHPKQRFLCDQCPHNCTYSNNLKNHKKVVHSLEIKSVGFDCGLCNISYLHKHLLAQHLKLYH